MILVFMNREDRFVTGESPVKDGPDRPAQGLGEDPGGMEKMR